MTQRWIVVALWLAASGIPCAWGQGGTGQAPGGAGAERARIDAVRQQKTAEFDAEDAACLSKFAVTDCQSRVGVRRRQMLADLKRQETSLNAVDRAAKGADQLQRGDEKAANSLQRHLEVQENAENAALEDRQKTQDDKRQAHQRQALPAGRKTPATKSTSTLDAKEVEKNREAFLEKQKALEKRRQERDQRVRDNGKGGPPLPVP